MDLTKYRALLFDLDGTLLDYTGAQLHAAHRILEAFDLERSGEYSQKVVSFLESKTVQDIEACKSSAMEPGSAEMRQEFRRAGIGVDPVAFMRTYFQALEEHGLPLSGIPDLLGRLKGRFTLGVVTNGPGSVQRKRLQRSGLMEFLDVLVISCEVKHAKPDPEILRYSMKLAGSETFSTLFVGDSAGSDMGAANAAGVDFVFVRPDGDFTAPGPRVLELRSTVELGDYLNQGE